MQKLDQTNSMIEERNVHVAPSLPYRLRESSFRRFELVIKAIVERYPDKTTFNPQSAIDKPLAQCTFACRLRDAMHSLLDNKWKTIIDFEKFTQIHPQLDVSEQPDGLVAVGPRESLKAPAMPRVPEIHNMVVEDVQVVIHLETLAERKLIALLASCRLLRHKVIISGLSDADVQDLEAQYDCRIDRISPTTHSIV